MISAIIKVFATKFAYRGLRFSKLSLISIGEGGRGPQNFPESKNHPAVPSGTSGAFSRLPYGYSTGKLGNITTIILLIRLHFYDLHDRAILSIRQRSSV